MRVPIYIFILILSLKGFLVSAQVGVHTDFPDNSSAMDIVSTNRGLLIPRVTLTSSLADPSPVTSPAVGLLVFNSGANQPIGFYYWNGSTWVAVSGSGGSGGGDYWSLTGNAGTSPGTNFLGTTDNQHFLIYTNNAERIRFESDGQVIVGNTTPNNSTDLFTVFGNSTQNAAINAYSPRTGFQTSGGRYGILSTVDTVNGYSMYSRNLDPLGYSIIAAGSGITTLTLIASHTAGISCYGTDGLHAWGKNADGYGIFAMGSNAAGTFNISGRSAGLSSVGSDGAHTRGSNSSGRGIIAVGSGQSAPSISNESEGGAFTGWHGVYAKGVNSNGTGVIGIGSNSATYSGVTGGVGGAFSGNTGVYGKGLAIEGIGVIGVGSNGSGYYSVTGGSGGSFTGYHGLLSVGVNTTDGIGVIGAGNSGSYSLPPGGAGGAFTGDNTGAIGFGTNSSSGIGIIGAGNNQSAWVPSNGAGGAFTGNTGVFSRSTNPTGTGLIALGNNLSTAGTFASGAGATFTGLDAGGIGWGTSTSGTGIIGTGNNITTPQTYTSGSGGAFTGTEAGLVGWGTTAATGIGVIGTGNNSTISIPSIGAGGAFTGLECGVYGYATDAGNETYGGYFSNGGGVSYVYVGYRHTNKNYKVYGNGLVSTIVKNTSGEPITMFCPEAPEVLFQDYGSGQLIDGHAHIIIDPDFTANINVDADHPLRVYITPEGDCNGVYVTNKTSNGFDVVELQGGQSNIAFSWQIVATRANEEFIKADGSVEVSDYSTRFDPAPGPLDHIEQPAAHRQMIPVELNQAARITSDIDSKKTDETHNSALLKVKDDQILTSPNTPDE